MTDRSKVYAVAKVFREQRAELARVADKLLLEYLERGGQFTGTEFCKQLGADSAAGKDITKRIEALIRALDGKGDKQ